METIATSVRITATANALLSDLAAQTGKPKAQIVEDALHHWEDTVFWAAVQSAFAGARESVELRAERELWECTVRDGLEPHPQPKKKMRPRPRARNEAR